ncbi:MAG: MBOAT family protein [Pirellulaceae bacterium]
MWLMLWALAVPAGVNALLPLSWPAWQRMWAVTLVMYAGCKEAMWRTRTQRDTRFADRLAWWLAWPGMNVDTFLSPADEARVRSPTAREWLFAMAKLAAGAVLVWGGTPWAAHWPPYWQAWVGMIGLAFLLHFGLFHALSCLWRSRGVAAPPIMDWPIAAQSVGDYWGNRWNRAFRDLATKTILRPILRRYGALPATMAVFLFSGLIHDLVISFPAGGGYGLPTIYFAIQGLAHAAEHSHSGRAAGLAAGWPGRLFAWGVVVLPSPLLFHPPFLERVVLPFLRALGATGPQG